MVSLLIISYVTKPLHYPGIIIATAGGCQPPDLDMMNRDTLDKKLRSCIQHTLVFPPSLDQLKPGHRDDQTIV